MEKQGNIRLSLDQGLAVEQDLAPDCSSAQLARILSVPRAWLLRLSVDARKKGDVHFVATVGTGSPEGAPQAIAPLESLPLPPGHEHKSRPVVVGMGPAGLFAALTLAQAGWRPILIERGAPVEERQGDVQRFWDTRVLNSSSNVQFGEGGAGTFSDGKLTCGKGSPLIRQVLETFVAAGAPQEILWKAKPHIGTDVLSEVVVAIRRRIIACGGTVLFHTCLVGLTPPDDSGTMRLKLTTPQGENELEARQVVLATGHSARDTFALLQGLGLAMEPKPFSMGVRIEHLQEDINRAQYGKAWSHPALGAADYKLNVHLPSGRGVYSFCMCPGGQVVAASSEEGMLCVNGMSNHARNGRNANAALLCGLTPQDYSDFGAFAGDPLAGVAFQRHWERQAFEAGGSNWKAPVQRLSSFTGAKKPSGSKCPEPSYPMGVSDASLNSCLPGFVSASLAQALPLLDRKLKGYANGGALMTAIEARSSSPLRILRDEASLQAVGMPGLYPCGEGAGYAGGIVSAALDGLRVAQQILQEPA